MIEKLISGGQTGSDQGALEAALELGIPTGGWIPKGFLTENGNDPSLGERFNLVEHKSRSYIPRTYTNVRDSDGTLIVSSDWSSAGTVCTQKAITQYEKPSLEMKIHLHGDELYIDELVPESAMKVWLKKNDIKVLNVAGNRESKFPGIQKLVKEYMLRVLS